jgi:hypothetical protein
VDILVKNQVRDQAVQRVLEIWRRDRPEEYKAYMDLIQEQYETLWRPDGVSRCGTVAYTGQIPLEVFMVLEKLFPELLKDPNGLIAVQRMLMGRYAPKAPRGTNG